MAGSGASQRPAKKTRNRRCWRFINPAFQWRYTVSVVAGVFFIYIIMSLVLFGVLHQQARGRVLSPSTTDVWENTIVMVLAAAAFATVLGLALAVWSFIMTHRICGPLHVMAGYFNELAEGRFPKRRPLRKKDEFKEFYDEFWRAIEAMKARERSNLAALSETLKMMRSAAGAAGECRRSDLESVAAQLQALSSELGDALGDKIDDPSAAPKESCE